MSAMGHWAGDEPPSKRRSARESIFYFLAIALSLVILTLVLELWRADLSTFYFGIEESDTF